MTFDEALDHLYTYSSTLGSGQTTQAQHEESKKVAIDVMRKYQKMQRSLDEIRAEIIKYEADCRLSVDEYPSCKQCTDNVFGTIYGFFDKYKTEIGDKK